MKLSGGFLIRTSLPDTFRTLTKREMGHGNEVDTIIHEHLRTKHRRIEEVHHRDVLTIHAPILSPLDHYVREALESLAERDENRRLLIVLTTPGGVVEVVERMVETIRHHYSDVAVVIPDEAMSAGTILALATDSIIMDYFSRLGPIDPQVVRKDGSLVPAMGYLLHWERIKELDRQGTLTMPELALAKELDLAELYDFEQATALSVTLLKKWLTTYKFKDWDTTATKKTKVTIKMKIKRAEQIARALGDITKWHSHSRGISRETLQNELNLKIDRLEDDPVLANAVTDFHDCLSDFIRKKPVEMWIQTRSYIRSQPQ